MNHGDRLGMLHVDMDSFFAAVEVLDDPTLRGLPVIVGYDGPRGVVASCTYQARAFGVHSAMPSMRAKALCPQAVFRPGRYERYQELSATLHQILHTFTPLVEGIGLDEAFLDVRGSVRLFGHPVSIARQIRQRVDQETGLACSVGVASTKFIAKLASKAAKPRPGKDGPVVGSGIKVVAVGEELEFLHPMTVDDLWGVGPATSKRLATLGIRTVGDLARTPPEALRSLLGNAAGSHLHLLARGIDQREVEPSREAKSISHEQTYSLDRFELEDLAGDLVAMADGLAARMERAGVSAKTVQLKVKHPDFSIVTRAMTADEPMRSPQALVRIGRQLLDKVDLSRGVRLLGLGVSGLSPAAHPAVQLSLLGDRAEGVGEDPEDLRFDAAADAVAEIRRRFGNEAVSTGLRGAPAPTVSPGVTNLRGPDRPLAG